MRLWIHDLSRQLIRIRRLRPCRLLHQFHRLQIWLKKINFSARGGNRSLVSSHTLGTRDPASLFFIHFAHSKHAPAFDSHTQSPQGLCSRAQKIATLIFVPEVGIEPTWPYGRQILSLLRLPNTPLGQIIIFNLQLRLPSPWTGFGIPDGRLRSLFASFGVPSEATARIELAHSAFAEHRITTFLRGRNYT